MNQPYRPVLDVAFDYAVQFLDGLPERRVFPETSYVELRKLLDKRGEAEPPAATQVIAELVETAERGVVASAGGRYFEIGRAHV